MGTNTKTTEFSTNMHIYKTLSLLFISNFDYSQSKSVATWKGFPGSNLLAGVSVAGTSTENTIDQVFVMDCTGSMGSYIETAKTKILDLAGKVSAKYPKMDLRLGFIGYRDITDWSGSSKQFIEIPFSTDYNTFKTALESKAFASGGGDLPEDVFTGLKAASELEWKGGVRMLTLLSDAPHNEKTGRKSYEDFKPVLNKFENDARISEADFSFSFFKIGDNTGDLGLKLKEIMPEGINFVEHKLEVQNIYISPYIYKPVLRPSFRSKGSKGYKGSFSSVGLESMGSFRESSFARKSIPKSMSYARSRGPMSRGGSMSRETSYMDTVFKDLSKSVDRYSSRRD